MHKICSHCKEAKHHTQFHTDISKRTRLTSWCSKCRNKKNKEWAKENPLDDDEKKRARECTLSWKKHNIERYRNTQKEYEKNAMEKYGYSRSKFNIYGLDILNELRNKKCSICKAKEDLVIHHINHKGFNYIKEGKKPDNRIHNLQIMCRSCHGRMHRIKYLENKKSFLTCCKGEGGKNRASPFFNT